MNNSPLEQLRNRPKQAFYFGAVLSFSSLSFAYMEGLAEQRYESRTAPFVDQFIQDAPYLQVQLQENRQLLNQ